MALTEHPADWHLIAPLPPVNRVGEELSTQWTLAVPEPVSKGYQVFPIPAPLSVAVKTRRTLQGAEVLIEIDGKVSTECRRCLSPLTVAIHEEFMYSYVLQSDDAETAQEEEEFYDSDTVVIPVSRLGNSVNVTGLVWECIVESLPAYAACPEGCAEVESVIPRDDRVDPRLLALADLLDKEN